LFSHVARLTAESPSVLDVRRTILARQALEADPELARLNLGVRVHNGVAVLWGPVPSAELARRAVERLQGLPELSGVRNDLFPDPWPDALDTAAAAPSLRVPGQPAALPDDERVPGRQSPGEAAHRPARTTPALPTPRTAAGAVSTPTARGAAPPREDETLTAIPAIRIPVPSSANPSAGAAAPSGGIEQAVRQLQQGQERFRRVRVAFEGDRVFLSGAVPAWRDLHELAQAITRIPGVGSVTLRDIRTDPSPR
jgi:osmotically-inducible protein OsmY